MNRRYAAVLSSLVIAGSANLARSDVPPPNACTVPGQPCQNACPTVPCSIDSGLAGVCRSTTCTRTGPILDAGPDSDGGIVIGPIKYPCNLCILGTIDRDAETEDAHHEDVGDPDAEAGGSGGMGGSGGTVADAGDASETGGMAGSGGNAGSGGASGTMDAGGTAGSAGSDPGGDSGCSCFIDTARAESSRPFALAFGLASVTGLFWFRRRSRQSPKKGGRSR